MKKLCPKDYEYFHKEELGICLRITAIHYTGNILKSLIKKLIRKDIKSKEGRIKE